MSIISLNEKRMNKIITKKPPDTCPKCDAKVMVKTISSIHINDVLVNNVLHITCFNCFYEYVDEELMQLIKLLIEEKKVTDRLELPISLLDSSFASQ